MLRIRAAQKEDIPRISAVLAESWKTAYRGIVSNTYLDTLKDDNWVDYLTTGMETDRNFAMVLENDDLIIGAAILGGTEIEHQVCLLSFYLLPDKIGHGFGHVFYSILENVLTEMGITSCVLNVLEENTRAIDFYAARKFIETGENISTKLGDQAHTCIVMEKSLTHPSAPHEA